MVWGLFVAHAPGVKLTIEMLLEFCSKGHQPLLIKSYLTFSFPNERAKAL